MMGRKRDMLNKNNNNSIRILTFTSVKSKKNYVAIISIILTTLLFTSMFTIISSLKKSMIDSDMRKTGTYAHAGLKHVTIDEYNKIINDKSISNSSYSIIIGDAEGDEFLKLPSEVRYGEEIYAKWTFNYPTKGMMPKEKKEIATSTLVLDALGIPHELGQEIKLKIETDYNVIQENFTLCGIWEGDEISYRQTIWLSQEYCNDIAPLTNIPSDGSVTKSTGYLDGLIMFPSEGNIEEQGSVLVNRYGLDDILTTNWAYDTEEMDVQNLMLTAFIAIIIFLSGYLLIYNIFYILVAQDIRYYGLLKIVGTTSKQIKKIVMRKAFVLSFIGIPIGLLCGWSIGRIILPNIVKILGENMRVITVIDAKIFIFSIIFSLTTVYLSCIRPARIASKVSAIEAIRYYSEKNNNFVYKRKTKQFNKLSIYIMSIQNVLRNRKKVFLVVLSFSLSLIILNSTYSYVNSFDFNKFVANTVVSDFSVADASIVNNSSPFNTAGVSKKFIEEVNLLNGIENIGNIYITASHQSLSDEAYNRIEDIINSWDEKKREDFRSTQIMVQRISGVNIFGFDDWPAEYIKVIDGNLDDKRWKNGEGIYITPCKMFEDGNINLYKVGDTIKIDFGEGIKKDYEVLAIVDYPSAFNSPMHYDLGLEYILPSNEFLNKFHSIQPMWTIFNVDEKSIDTTEEWLSNYCKAVEKNLDFHSKNTLKSSFSNLIMMYSIVGGTLCAIVGVIGILNFINSMITSIFSRKKELTILKAIGMTSNQMKLMLIYEGSIYSILAFIISIIISSIVNITVIPALGENLYYFTSNFTFKPILICIVPLVIITIIIPIVCYYMFSKKTVVENLRDIE